MCTRRRSAAVVLTAGALLLAAFAGAALAGRPASSPPSSAAAALAASLAREQGILTAAAGAARDQLGWSVDVDGDTAVVGAPYADVGGSADQGSAYVFVRSGGVWTQQERLTAADGAAGDQFGRAVAVDGDTIVVGAPQQRVGADGARGAVYVFTRSGTVWGQEGHLTAAGAMAGAFGSSVALDGDTALVGDPSCVVGAYVRTGAAFVFERSGTTWNLAQQLVAGAAAADDWFGSSVALDGDTALVGAPGDNAGTAVNHGAATVFVRSGSSWSAQAELTGSGGASNERFGDAVSLDGDTAVIGAPFDHVGAVRDQGAAYVFVRSGTTWPLDQRLLGTDREPQDDHFGGAVCVQGDTVLVGAPENEVERESGADASAQGTVFAYVRSGGTWTRQARLTAANGAVQDHFGFSVSLSGDTALAGALDDDIGGRVDQGSARVLVGTRPLTTVRLKPAANIDGWNRRPVKVTLSARDVFSGVAETLYRPAGDLDWIAYDAPFAVSKNGVTTWEYASRDRDGNVEATKRLRIRIDTTRPVTVALANATVRRGAKVTLRFRVNDAIAPKAYGKIKIYKGSVLKTSTMFPLWPTNTRLRTTFVCKLPRGRYTWKVYAADIANNKQSKVGARTLTVR